MTHAELRQAAIDCLHKAFTGGADVSNHVVQAATAIVLSPEPKP